MSVPPQSRREMKMDTDLRSSDMLHSVYWQFVTDVSWQPIGPISRGQAAQEDCLTVGDGIDRFSRNVGCRSSNLWPSWSLTMGPISCSVTSITNNRCTLRNIPEERRPHLHRCGIPKSSKDGRSAFVLTSLNLLQSRSRRRSEKCIFLYVNKRN